MLEKFPKKFVGNGETGSAAALSQTPSGDVGEQRILFFQTCVCANEVAVQDSPVDELAIFLRRADCYLIAEKDVEDSCAIQHVAKTLKRMVDALGLEPRTR